MDFLTWGRDPWDQPILTHLSWDLLWASLFAGVVFLVAHASYMVLSAHRKRHAAETDAMEAARTRSPASDRSSFAGRAPLSLGHGGGDVDAALHGVSADRGDSVCLGDLALGSRTCAHRIDSLSHPSRHRMAGLLVDLGRPA